MRIAVDAMGGDIGPKATVPGALRAAEDFGLDVLLVGLEGAINREIGRSGLPAARATVINAPEEIGMGEGLLAFRK